VKIALLGASGATGREVMKQALSAGDEVRAVVRTPGSIQPAERLAVVEAKLGDKAKLAEAFTGADAVVSALGVSERTPDEPPSSALPEIVAAMREAKVKRFVGVSCGALAFTGDDQDLPGKIASALLRFSRKPLLEDKQRELDSLTLTDFQWTLVRAARLVDGPVTGQYQVSLKRLRGRTVSRADVAHFALSVVRERSYLQAAPFLSAPAS